ncbi:MAG: hypothetical protein E7658_03200 [Ruminococcaceae bacterium]|nr:hypothetical protein [Oscillospiraceae bacterium]
MKPTSIISLIVAVMLVICGSVTCMIAKGMAEADGNSLFAQKRGDEFVNTVSLADTAVNAVDLTVTNATVYIHGQSTNAYAEIINFNDNNYTVNTGNQVFTFKEVPDLISMLKFWENGFSFKGMRYIFNTNQPSADDERSVHIYLGTSDTKISEVTLHAEGCDIYIDNVSTGYDFKLFLEDCNVAMDTISLTNELAVVGENISMDVSGCLFGKISVQSTALHMNLSDILVSVSADIRYDTGDVDISLPAGALTGCKMNLQALNNGSVTVNGNMLGSSYSVEGEGIVWTIHAEEGGSIRIADTNS